MKTESNKPAVVRSGLHADFLFIAENQFSVNAAMAGEDWVARAAEHQDIDYRVAALDEVNEFINCAWQFKWWAPTKLDFANARMEMVDILHFVVSEDLAFRMVVGNLQKEEAIKKVASLIDEGLNAASKGESEYAGANSTEEVTASRVTRLKKSTLLFTGSLVKGVVDWENFWKMVLLCEPEKLFTPTEQRAAEVCTLYNAKAVLNRFRTRYRKSPAGYSKVWVDGREDNELMMNWLALQDRNPDKAEIDHWLETTYASIIHTKSS